MRPGSVEVGGQVDHVKPDKLNQNPPQVSWSDLAALTRPGFLPPRLAGSFLITNPIIPRVIHYHDKALLINNPSPSPPVPQFLPPQCFMLA